MSTVIILLRLGGGQDTYIHSYRSNLGLNSTTVGGVSEILAFVLFAIGIFVVHIFLALEFYKVRKTAGWVVVSLTTLLLVLSLIVAYAILDQR